MAKCYHCKKKAKHDIRGIKCCAECYITALEHSADVVLLWPKQLPREHRFLLSYLSGLSDSQLQSLVQQLTDEK